MTDHHHTCLLSREAWDQAPFTASEPADQCNCLSRAVQERDELMGWLYQYRDDLRYPPAPDSVERRLAAIGALILKISSDPR